MFTYTHINVQSLKNEFYYVFLLGMVNEMTTLEKKTIRILCPYQEGKKLWAANGYLQLSIELK